MRSPHNRLGTAAPSVGALLFFALVICPLPIGSPQHKQRPDGGRALTELRLGDIVGAEYFSRRNEFALYATAGEDIVLQTDDVARIALAILCCSQNEFAFSLEPERLGYVAFKRQDLLDPSALVSKLRSADTPLARHIVDLLPDQSRTKIQQRTAADFDEQVLANIISTLNRLQKAQDLYDAVRFPDDLLSPEVRQLARGRPKGPDLRRLNRLLLEDAFPKELGRDLGDRMQIRYLADNGEELTEALRNTTVEATLLYVDRALKDLAQGRKLADGLNLGANEIFLCSGELEQWMRAGRSMTDYPRRPYVTYYQLNTNLAFDRFEEAGIWFRDPRLVVKAASIDPSADPPPCVRQFAENLSAHMSEVLAHPRAGSEFRRLRALLLICRALGWAQHIFVPMNRSMIEALPTRTVRHAPPQIRELLLAIGYAGISVRGGILLNQAAGGWFPISDLRLANSGASPRDSGWTERRQSARAKYEAGFRVSSASYPGLLKIDLTDILGLQRKE